MRLLVAIAAFHTEAIALNGNGIPVVHRSINHVNHSSEADNNPALTSGLPAAIHDAVAHDSSPASCRTSRKQSGASQQV
ncbi:MAG UNVERIFIED_CONTAM: hypothetical protein LVR18_10235 [Planctomycetaceae bacterium]|jgi:hypothetical protein